MLIIVDLCSCSGKVYIALQSNNCSRLVKIMAIPGIFTSFGEFRDNLSIRDNNKKSGSVPDVPGRLATMSMPVVFRKNFKACVIIIDCFEVFI